MQRGQWDAERGGVLTLTVSSEVRALTEVKVVVPSSVGIQLPPDGIVQVISHQHRFHLKYFEFYYSERFLLVIFTTQNDFYW